MDVVSVRRRIEAVAPRRPFVLVGIGGRGGSGKTTLATALPGACVVGTDEFWNGSEFELSRLRREVFDRLLAGEQARFASFDWAAHRARGERTVEPEGLIVIEGVCALHRMFRAAYDLRVWIEAPRHVRLARALAREGEDARRIWEEVWLPAEDRYVERDDPMSAADLLVDGSGGEA